ncbi:glycerophosphodiester phosphodiesterase family protein [Bacillus sp. 03113]|uniref:glycerophosphodiester phosphodiesterase n=1 Tax=Bacillus sp. 03113 TaxID=2578211 RepID=UPI0011429CA9|nr:glycerophosphodiester phosphodiesterase family protein [Bacillus sp. 03113]
MRVKAIAHRGYPVKYPENTLSSFQAAYELGFSIVELDVHLSKDGIPVVMHDRTIDRMTNGKGFVQDFTMAELKSFTVKGGERIPTLEEALTLLKDQAIVSIELKQDGQGYFGLEEAVLQTIKKLDMVNQVYVISFNFASIAKMRQLSDEIELGPIIAVETPSIFQLIEEVKAKYLAIKIDCLSDKYVIECEKRGIQLIIWPVDTEEEMKQVQRYPSVLGTTNELERFVQLFYQY